jgi:hypothetical protein
LLKPKSLGAKQGRGDNLLIQLVWYNRKYSPFNTPLTDDARGVTKGVHKCKVPNQLNVRRSNDRKLKVVRRIYEGVIK